MEDNVMRAGMDAARARARWFLLPGGFWIVIGVLMLFSPPHDFRAFFAFVGLASPYLILWYFASQGKSWAFFVGAILNALGTVISLFTGQIIGIGISGFVTYRLWIAFLDCAALETARRAHAAEVATRGAFPTRVSSLSPPSILGARLPTRIAEETDTPAPTAWVPYRPPQSASPAAATPPKETI
jgi:hypothetical protein